MRWAFLLYLVACVEPEPALPTDSASVAAIAAVRARLMAPYSARFRHITPRDTVVCGEVAAMNAARDYTGWRRFAVTQGHAYLAPDSLATALCPPSQRPRRMT